MNRLATYHTPRTDLWSAFDYIFDDMFGVSPYVRNGAKTNYPRVDVIEYDDKIVLEADVAGLNKEDVSVDLEGDYIVIRGGKKQQSEVDPKKGRYLFKEIKRSSFTRSFYVGEEIDKKKIKAEFKDGTLHVEFPRLKLEDKRPERIKLL